MSGANLSQDTGSALVQTQAQGIAETAGVPIAGPGYSDGAQLAPGTHVTKVDAHCIDHTVWIKPDDTYHLAYLVLNGASGHVAEPEDDLQFSVLVLVSVHHSLPRRNSGNLFLV